ncbi:MAG: YcxB family protein [Roseiarcus sp.]
MTPTPTQPTARAAGPSIEFTYSVEDFIASYKLASAPTRRIWLVGALCALAAGAFLFAVEASRLEAFLIWLPALAGAAIGGLAQWAVYVPWRARRIYGRYPLADRPRRFSLDREGLRIGTERGEILMSWTDFTRWRANRKTILLYTSPGGAFVPVPARLAALGFPIAALESALAREVGPASR